MARLSVVAGANQSVVVANQFPLPVQVMAFDDLDQPEPGVEILVQAPGTGPSGTFDNGTPQALVTTDIDGLAIFPPLTANTIAGRLLMLAYPTGDQAATVNFDLFANADVPAAITAYLGDNQTAAVNTPFGLQLQARVLDQYLNPVPGVVCQFDCPLQGPTATWPPGAYWVTGTTNANGIVGATGAGGVFTLTAGLLAGAFQATVRCTSAPTVAPALYSLANVAGPVYELLAHSGTPQGAALGLVYPVPMVVRATDQYGNSRDGVVVTFTAPDDSPSGTFPDGTKEFIAAPTAPDGTTSAGAFSADMTTGTFRVSATMPAGAVTEALFLLTNLLARDPIFDDTDWQFVSPDGEGINLLVLRGQYGRLMPTAELWEQEVPGVPGYRFLGARHTGREIGLPCYIEAPNARGLGALRQLARILDPTKGAGSLRVRLADGTVRQIGATYAGGLDVATETNPNGIWAVPLMFRCPDPYWTDGTLQSAVAGAGVRTIELVNDGDYEAWPLIRVIGPTNPFVLVNTLVNQKIELRAPSTADLVIDCRPGHRSVVIDGNPNYSALSQDSQLFPLAVGAQTLTIDGAPAATTSFTWARRYLSI